MWMSLLLSLSTAHAEPLASSELPNTGHTLPKGAAALHVFGSSAVAVTDALELKSNLLGLIGGPNLGLEYALKEGKKGAMSLGVSGSTNWRFSTQSISGNYIYTMGGPLENRLNLSAGGGYIHGHIDGTDINGNVVEIDISGPTTSLSAGYDIVPKPRTAFQLYAAADPYNCIVGKAFYGSAGATWNHSWERARLRLGLVVVPTGDTQSVVDALGLDFDLPPVLPLPTFDVWWRF